MAGEISPPITAPLVAIAGIWLWSEFAAPILVPMPGAFGQTVDAGFLLGGVAGYLAGFAIAFTFDSICSRTRKEVG